MDHGLCQCGCGGRTKIAPRTHNSRGWVKGEPQPYLRGHAAWKDSGPQWIEGPGPEHRPDLGPCWIWQRSFNNENYPIGSFARFGYVGQQLAYRVLYVQAMGPIPDGLELDHLCRVPACVRPSHMEPVTGRVNILRQPRTKLTDDDVRAAYEMRLNGRTWRSIAAEFDVKHPPLMARVRAWCERHNATYV